MVSPPSNKVGGLILKKYFHGKLGAFSFWGEQIYGRCWGLNDPIMPREGSHIHLKNNERKG